MKLNTDNIKNPRLKSFYQSYLKDRKIIHDFYELLSEDKYDYRMVDTSERKSDSPRETLAHILEVQLMYLNGIKTGTLEFKDMDVNHYWNMSKQELLDEMNTVDQKMLEYVNSNDFNPDSMVRAPWGDAPAMSILNAFRDHEILHQGWNLALMDHLNMPRYKSLKDTWGE